MHWLCTYYLQVYKGADVNSTIVIDKLNHSNEGVREFDLHSEGISFIYYSDLSHPGSEVEGKILAGTKITFTWVPSLFLKSVVKICSVTESVVKKNKKTMQSGDAL